MRSSCREPLPSSNEIAAIMHVLAECGESFNARGIERISVVEVSKKKIPAAIAVRDWEVNSDRL